MKKIFLSHKNSQIHSNDNNFDAYLGHGGGNTLYSVATSYTNFLNNIQLSGDVSEQSYNLQEL